MDLKNMSLRQLRQYCIENSLVFLDVLSERDNPKKVEEKPKKKAPEKTKIKSPKEIVLQALDDMRDIYSSEEVSLEDFAEYVESDLRKDKIEYCRNCPLIGFVSQTLYEYAEQAKFGKGRIDKKRLADPVKEEELESLLGVNFGSGLARIAGILSPKTARSSYPLDGRGRLSNQDGEYNIEGTHCWIGDKKEKARRTLTEIVSENIFKKITDERATRYGEISDEIEKIKDKLKGAEEANENRGKKVIIKAEERGRSITIKQEFIHHLKRRGLVIGNRRINGRLEKNKVVFYVSAKDEKSFDEAWENYFSMQGKEFKRRVKIEEITLGTKERDRRLEKKLSNLETDLSLIERERPSINYLGLEGPNFASFLDISYSAQESGIAVNATIAEYNHRYANLMRSIKDSGISKVFDDVLVEERNIDDLILLDFVKNPKVRIESNGEMHVSYSTEKIELQRYNELLDEIDNGGKTLGHLASKYSLSEKFVEVVSERQKKYFDVVFLDYVGGVTDKRNKVLETLVRRNLKDKSVIAITSNLNPKVNHEMLVEKIPDFHFDNLINLSDGSGFEVGDVDDKTYSDNGNPMYFSVYYLRRK